MEGEQPSLSDQENGVFRGKHRSALAQRGHGRRMDQTVGRDYFVCLCVCVGGLGIKKNLTFRELLNRPAGDARRQAPQVEGNGCGVNYLE